MFYKIFRVLGRKFLALFNLRIVKVSLTEQMLNILLRKENIKFLQIGANDGISFDCLYDYVTKYQWSGVVVEPLIDFYQKLCLNYEYFDCIKPVNIAIHPNLKEFNLYRVDPKFHKDLPHWVRGSASFSYDNLIKQGIRAEQITLNSVKSIPLMELVSLYQLFDIDYLQIDVEGMDGEIIRMIDFTKMKPKLIRFEWMHMQEKEISELKQILIKNGYKFKHDKTEFFAFTKEIFYK